MRGSLPQVFQHCVPSQNQPNVIYSSYRMSESSAQCQPVISDCYKELMADPSLLQSFLEDEWMSGQGLPYLHAIHFHVVLEIFFT